MADEERVKDDQTGAPEAKGGYQRRGKRGSYGGAGSSGGSDAPAKSKPSQPRTSEKTPPRSKPSRSDGPRSDRGRPSDSGHRSSPKAERWAEERGTRGGPQDGRSTRSEAKGRSKPEPRESYGRDRPSRDDRGGGRPSRDDRSERRGPRGERDWGSRDRDEDVKKAPKSWGGVARRGAGVVSPGSSGQGPLKGKGGGGSSSRDGRPERPPKPEGREHSSSARGDEQWIDEGPVRDSASGAVDRGRGRTPNNQSKKRPTRPSRKRETVEDAPPVSLPDADLAQLRRGAGPDKADRYAKRLKDAARAYGREHYTDALRLLRPLADRVPAVSAVRELHGLTLYRLGRWKLAIVELEAYRQLSGSVDQLPVLADCYRALGQWAAVDETWQELKTISPGAELVTEGRIVAAGALADRGELAGAIELLDLPRPVPKAPKDHHLRRAYVLADLLERAGDTPRSRAIFAEIIKVEPDFADAADRLR